MVSEWDWDWAEWAMLVVRYTEFQETRVAHPGVTPCAPSWLEPKCSHWHPWTFPQVHVDVA